MKGYVSLALLLSFAFFAGKVNTEDVIPTPESTNTSAPNTTLAPTTTQVNATTQVPTNTTESTNTSAPNTTLAPTTTQVNATTQVPTNTTESTNTSAPNTTLAPTTTQVNATTQVLNTTESTNTSAPNTTLAPTTTQVNATTQVPTNTTESTNTSAPNTTLAPTTTQVNATTQVPTNTTESTNTSAPNTTLAPTTIQVNATTQVPTNTTESTNTSAPNTTLAPTTTQVNATTQVPTNTTESTNTSAPNTTLAPTTIQVNATTQVPTNTTESTNTSAPNTTLAPTTTQELPVTTAPPATTEAPLLCANKPCNGSAKCINLYQDYTCQCPYGYYYTASGCQEGKVFPGQFTLSISYSDSMANEGSSEYKQLYTIITDFFKTTFKNETDYEETIIVNIKQSSAKSKIQNKAGTSGTIVTVKNMFKVTTKLNSSEVKQLIEDAMKSNSNFSSGSYQGLVQCDVYGCDEATTTCQDTDGVTCECKSGFSKKNPEDKSCSGCDNTCSEEKHMHCVIERDNVPACQCLPNFQNKDGNCLECNVGYSGVNCSNNSLLILIIVAALCGALILGLTVGLIFTSQSANKRQRNPEKRHLLKGDYSNERETPGHVSAIKSAANDKIFPRIQISNAAQVNRGFEMSNPYEMGPPTRRLPERDYDDDDEYEISSKGDGFRLQRRY